MTQPEPANSIHASVQSLITLLSDFEVNLHEKDLREKVQSLVPVHEILAKIGRSLIPREIASSALNRLLYYFRQYPHVILPREELCVVAAISEWARRVRQLRVEYGWAILSGKAAKEMAREGDLPTGKAGIDVNAMHADDYVLISEEQDREAAYRWHVAKTIRNQPGGVREKILQYLLSNVGQAVTGEELRYVAKDRTEWARRVRELRTEHGWPIVTKNSGRPDLPIGVYILEQDRQSPPHDRNIPDPVRVKVLSRDNYQCRACGWNHDRWNRSDPRHLELHHIRAHELRGENTEDNLITLCTICHDDWHREEEHWNELGFEAWLAQKNRESNYKRSAQ
jgi:hypothetical protein